MQNQKNINSKTVIKIAIILAAILVLLAGAFLIYKATRPKRINNPTVTVMKYYMGKIIDDSDLQNIETRIREIVGDKFESVEKGVGIAATTEMTGDAGEVIDPGDGITITCAVLEIREKEDIFNMLATEYGIFPSHQIESFDIAR